MHCATTREQRQCIFEIIVIILVVVGSRKWHDDAAQATVVVESDLQPRRLTPQRLPFIAVSSIFKGYRVQASVLGVGRHHHHLRSHGLLRRHFLLSADQLQLEQQSLGRQVYQFPGVLALQRIFQLCHRHHRLRFTYTSAAGIATPQTATMHLVLHLCPWALVSFQIETGAIRND